MFTRKVVSVEVRPKISKQLNTQSRFFNERNWMRNESGNYKNQL